MNRTIRFFVDGEPKGKGRPRFVRATGHALTPPASASYERMVKEIAAQAMGPQAMLEGPLQLSIEVFCLAPASWSAERKAAEQWVTSKPDLDNIVKMFADALNGVVYKDDSRIATIVCSKRYSDIGQGADVTVSEIPS